MVEPLLPYVSRGTIVLADKAYDSNAFRYFAKHKQAWANIAVKSNWKASFPFSAWLIVSAISSSNSSANQTVQAIATQYDKDLFNLFAAIKLLAARILIWAL